MKEYNKKKLQQSSSKKKVIAKTKYAKNKVRQEQKSEWRWKPGKKGEKKRPAHDFREVFNSPFSSQYAFRCCNTQNLAPQESCNI